MTTSFVLLDIDPVAVQRRIDGWTTVSLNYEERVEAVRILSAQGRSKKEIAAQLGYLLRTVERIKSRHRIESTYDMWERQPLERTA